MAKGTDRVTSIVLAGGQGRRLGRDKVWLELAGQNLLARVVARLAPLGGEVILVLNRARALPPLPRPVRLAYDLFPGKGSLGGLYTGLKAATTCSSLVIACDMPFLNLSLLRFMLSLAPGYDVVVPRVGEHVEPLHAVYSQSCLEPMATLMEHGGFRIIDFFPQVRVRYVTEAEIAPHDPRGLSFFNINTPQEAEQALRWLQKEG